jgi:D-amino-acid oxidase
MSTPATDVLVVGAGVSGLTTAICLAEAGLRVRVLAKDPLNCTTSAAAGASWGPYLLDDDRERAWSRQTLDMLTELAADEELTGVRMVEGLEASDEDMEIPAWARAVKGFQECPREQLPYGYVVGWRYRLPLVDMDTYLPYLEARLLATGGCRIEPGFVRRLSDVRDQASVVVNCTGLGARDLVQDPNVSPLRGQLVVVRNPGVDTFFQDQHEGEDMTYFLPHGDKVVLGGSALRGVTAAQPDRAIADAIVARCARVEPRLAQAERIADRVGFRPTREVTWTAPDGSVQVKAEVRVEREGSVVHNYGHGGSGLTLSWGCGPAVVELVQQAMADTNDPDERMTTV